MRRVTLRFGLAELVSLTFSYGGQINSVQDHVQSARINFESSRRKVLQVWESEGTLLQNLVPNRKAVTIPIQCLNSISALVFENE